MTVGEMDAARGVLVLGMHRSGTSAVTRAINLLGVPLCRPDDLFESDGNNVSGYWESRTMMQFNNELLTGLGSSWRCPPRRIDVGSRRLVSAAKVGRERMAASHPTVQWAWKDPRNCALVPFWRTALPMPLVAVTVLRHPLEIATSLASQRERFSRPEALALWERNLRLVLRDCAGMAMLVTCFDDLMAEPMQWAAAARAFLEHNGVRLHPDDNGLRAFVDEGLRHHREPDPVLTRQSGATAEQITLWELALGLVGAHEPYVAPGLPEESSSTQGLLARRLPSRARRVAAVPYRALRRRGRRAGNPAPRPPAR